jgi:hypothetical protein
VVPGARLWVGSLSVAVGLGFVGCGGGGDIKPPGPTITPQRWGPAVEIGTAEVTPYLGWPHATYFATAMNDAGDATVVFDNLEHFGAPSLVAAHYAARRGSWTAAASLVGGGAAGASTPEWTSRLAMDASGNAFLVWNQDDYPVQERSVYASRFDVRSGAWGSVVRLSRDFSGDVIAHDVAADGKGGAQALFMSTEGDVGLRAGRYSDLWQRTWLFDLGPSATVSRGCLLLDSDGGALAAWAKPGSGSLDAGNQLVTRRHSVRAGWEAEATVPLGTGVDPNGTRTIGALGVSSAGDAFLLWQDWSTRGVARIHASRFDSAARWTAPSLLDTVDIGTQGGAVDPKRVQPGDHGLVLASWGPRFSRYDPASGWSAPVEVESALATGLEGHAGAQHQIALDAAGNALVIGRDAATQRPSFATYVFGKGWGEVSLLDATITYDYTPFLVGNRKGRLALAWAEGMDFVPVYCGSFGRCTAPTRVRLWARFYE